MSSLHAGLAERCIVHHPVGQQRLCSTRRSSSSSRHGRREAQCTAFPSGVATLADVMVQTAPTNSAAAQSTVQNLLMNPTGAGQELPGRLLIAATLTAVAVGGYLLREKARKQ